MDKKAFFLAGIISAALIAPVAQAASTDTFVVSGTYGQSGYVYTPGMGSASATVSISGAGVNQTATLMHWSNDPTNGYQYWRGLIPMDAVTSTGIAGISVTIDTCEVDNRAGCGYVDLSVRSDVPASGWVDNGVNEITSTGYIYRQVGSRIVRFASSTGSVNGIPVDSTRAFMSKGTDVTISVTTGE
jgi:hypothetical protein